MAEVEVNHLADVWRHFDPQALLEAGVETGALMEVEGTVHTHDGDCFYGNRYLRAGDDCCPRAEDAWALNTKGGDDG